MPITLITGGPGNGKSVRLLYLVETRRREEKREVYYSGIADCLLPWHLFGLESTDPKKPHMTDPSNWDTLPEGSIIVIDECQRLFRPRPVGSKVPDYVAALETHRHKGFDIYLVTQAPALIDSNVRNLVETHEHLMRKFGSQWATVHAWKGVKFNCIVSRKDSQESQFVYPKEVYTWFKSAEVHTVKRNIPTKVKLFFGCFVVLLGAAGYAWHAVSGIGKPSTASPQVQAAPGQALASRQNGPQGAGQASPGRSGYHAPQTPQALYASYQPRIPGLPYTAPRYDELTAPVRVPVVVGCWQTESGSDGWCITQQGTRLKLDKAFMASFIEAGSFLDFEPGPPPGSGSTRQSDSPSKDRTGPQRTE